MDRKEKQRRLINEGRKRKTPKIGPKKCKA
jgi:hypothetical protein